MQYEQFNPLSMSQAELRIQFATIRADLKSTERELERINRELTDLKNRPAKKSPLWKMALGAGMSILIALNSILVNMGTNMLSLKPPDTGGYILIGFASFVYVFCTLVIALIVGRESQ